MTVSGEAVAMKGSARKGIPLPDKRPRVQYSISRLQVGALWTTPGDRNTCLGNRMREGIGTVCPMGV